MKVRTFVAIAIAAGIVPVTAQEQGPGERAEAVRIQLAEKITTEGMQQRMAVEARFTQGAPYSGEAINESMQLLADGNRIATKTATRIYRDSEGRTRRETVSANGQIESISISDPVAGVTYVLDPRNKSAYRSGTVMVMPSSVSPVTMTTATPGVFVATRTPEGGVVTKIEAEGKAAAETRARTLGGGGRGAGGTPAPATTIVSGGRGGVFAATTAPMTVAGKTTREDLGQQVVEGVLATGTRSTTLIDAGVIGNDRPIQIVSEQWSSPDLKLLVMTKHSDPRTGESTYRLTNITQAEQPRSLFELPPDYTLKESTIRQRQAPLEK